MNVQSLTKRGKRYVSQWRTNRITPDTAYLGILRHNPEKVVEHHLEILPEDIDIFYPDFKKILADHKAADFFTNNGYPTEEILTYLGWAKNKFGGLWNRTVKLSYFDVTNLLYKAGIRTRYVSPHYDDITDAELDQILQRRGLEAVEL